MLQLTHQRQLYVQHAALTKSYPCLDTCTPIFQQQHKDNCQHHVKLTMIGLLPILWRIMCRLEKSRRKRNKSGQHISLTQDAGNMEGKRYFVFVNLYTLTNNASNVSSTASSRQNNTDKGISSGMPAQI